MDKEHLSQLVNLLKDRSQDTFSNNAVVISVNDVLLSGTPITDYVTILDGAIDVPKCSLDKSSIGPMARFLKDFKESGDPLDNSLFGIDFAVKYLETLQSFAQKRNAERTVVSEINGLLEALRK